MAANSSNSSEPISNENVARILALLRTGDANIGSTRVDNAIVIIGKSGSGKTTLTNFLVESDEDLISEELGQDTGDFIIRDKTDKISDGNSTIISKTIFPELIHDRETRTAYIDCPGFNDRGRNEVYDIAAAYFIKKVLENVKNIKIVLTANYPSLQSGVSRDDFPHLLERVTTLIKNIDRYVESVALIATKVYNSYTKSKIHGKVDLVLVPDKLVIENMAKFLVQVKESLKKIQTSDMVFKSNVTLSQNESFFDSSKKLLDALLDKNGSEYTRLGLFRRPDNSGPISEIKLLQNGKQNLKNMLKNNLKYVPVDSTNIGYAVSDKSKNIIRDLVEEINKSIAADMSQIKDIMLGFFKRLENDLFDDSIYTVKEHLEAWSISFAKISAINELAKANQIVSLMENNFTEVSKLAEPLLNDIKILGRFMDFLEDVSDKKFDSFVWKWIGELGEAVVYVENSLKWYNFLIALNGRLSDYDTQKDIQRFHVPKFEMASGGGRLENFTDFSKFFEEISNSRLLNVQYLKELQKVTIDDTKVRYFNQVIESTLQRPINFTLFQSPGPRLQVTGEYVKISDVILHSDYRESKSVQVFATHTVFIDADMTKENDISIIAPRWVIIGSRVINLNGSSAEDCVPLKASNGSYADGNGQNGSPGKPGKSAGHFFGVGDEFENAAQLQIQATGGVGGQGQDGGDGAKGDSGTTLHVTGTKDSLHCPLSEQCLTKISSYKSRRSTGSWWGNLFNSQPEPMDHTLMFRKYGSPGRRGGDAGRAGAPGLGGFAGNVTLIGLGNEKPSISKKVAKGNDGASGLNGKCGDGGEGGSDVVFSVCIDCGPEKIYHEKRSSNGAKGVCLSSLENSNLEGRANPTTKVFLHSPSFVISDFRNELVKNLDNCVRKSHSINFYKMLQRDEILKYDNIDLIFSEFQQLEQHFYKFHPNLRKTLYESVLKRIDKISKSSNGFSKNTTDGQFEFLSSAVRSKVSRSQKNQHVRLVSNLREYLDMFKTTNSERIDRYFIGRAGKEIKQIENLIKIAISDIRNVIERCIFKISNNHWNESEKLNQQLLKLKLFSNLTIIGEFLDLVASLAKIDLALIPTMRITNVLPSVEISFSALEGSMINTKLAVIKKTVEKEIGAIENAILNEIQNLQSLGDEFDVAADDLQDVLMNLKSRSTTVDKPCEFSMFSNLRDEILTINRINNSVKNFSPKGKETVSKFEKDMRIIQLSVHLFGALSMKEFDGLSLKSAIDNIQEKGINFDENVREVLHSCNSVLVTVKNNFTGDSFKPEDIKKLRIMISRAIGTIKLFFNQLIVQFEVDEDLQTITRNFDEVLNQLSTIFDVVLPGQHDRAFFKNLHSQLKKKEEPNNQLQNYSTEAMGADALLYKYEYLIDVCKMAIFPFDVLTNNKLSLPALPHVDRSSVQYKNIIASNIVQLETELLSWEQRIRNVTIAEYFDSGSKNGAFVVWRSDQHKESISKLLRGRAVVFKAQIKVGDKRQMLKFDNIRLRFTSGNLTVQKSLDKDLKYFNVSLTHMGNSYFSLCNRVRLVHQDATRFNYNFNETASRIVDPINGPLKLSLSPFAMWIFKLQLINDKDADASFSILNPYRKLPISVELAGNATYVDSLNRTVCQKIELSSSDIRQFATKAEISQEPAKNISDAGPHPSTTQIDETAASNSSFARELSSGTDNGITLKYDDSVDNSYELDELKTIDRKPRDIGSSNINSKENRTPEWWNPFDYFSSTRSNPTSGLPLETKLLKWYEKRSPNINYSPPLNINGTLAFIDFVIRNIAKIKPHRSTEKCISAEEARVIALNIIEELENMLSQLPEEKHISAFDWQEKDPVELVGRLEKNILTGDLSSVKEILFNLVSLDVPNDELDSLLERHLGSAEIRGNFENHRNTVPDDRGKLSGKLNIDSTNHTGIPVANESLNFAVLN